MEEKILTILLDMQVDIKDLKKRVINIEENERITCCQQTYKKHIYTQPVKLDA